MNVTELVTYWNSAFVPDKFLSIRSRILRIRNKVQVRHVHISYKIMSGAGELISYFHAQCRSLKGARMPDHDQISILTTIKP